MTGSGLDGRRARETVDGGDVLGPDGLDELHDRFRQHVQERLVPAIRRRVDRYVEALEDAVSTVDQLAVEEPEEDGAARGAIHRRFRFADRFHDRFSEALFEAADTARDDFVEELLQRTDDLPELPATVRATNTDEGLAPELVRPRWSQRVLATVRRPDARSVPVGALAEQYIAELAKRSEPMASDVARLLSLAVDLIRRLLHRHTELEHAGSGDPPDLRQEADRILAEFEATADVVVSEFGEALRAPAVRVPEGWSVRIREQVERRRAKQREEWLDFERALMANVASESVLARALASLEATVAGAAHDLEALRDAHGAAPLDRLVESLGDFGARAEDLLEEDPRAHLESLADEAVALFRPELPRLRGLADELEATVDALIQELAEIPGQVPDDLHISEHPVHEIPSRPRSLELRDAPLEELLNTACGGALPRWLEKSLTNAQTELDTAVREADRAANAVAFHLKAPLRGGFEEEEIRGLVAGITERAAAQLGDLREDGLAAVDSLVAGLEERTREEAETLRSAVAKREFMRIHSEIAEEQAVRQLSTGVERARGMAGWLASGARKALDGGRRVVTVLQDWAQRQLGVDEVEREEMLESLEQSLIGAAQDVVALPPMYRLLFDVEADVPWDELLVSRDEALDVIRRAHDRWREDRPATLAVVGEKGSGKTTLIDLARRHVFGDARLLEMSLGRTIDNPFELEARLRELFGIEEEEPLTEAINAQDRAVVVVEDVHHLFIRALGGFEAMERFLEIVVATSPNVLWTVTVDESAWRFLTRVIGLDAHFVHTVSTTDLSPEKLEEAIMARHSVSGFALEFETEDKEDRRGWWARLTRREPVGELTRKEEQRRRFFRELADIAEGNIVLGLFYWLRSIRRMDEHVMVLGTPEIIDLEFLDRLPLAQLHTIAAIILHGGLTEPAHRRIFQLPTAESRLQLAALADAHMVFLTSDGEYKINKVLYRPFMRLLASKNIF